MLTLDVVVARKKKERIEFDQVILVKFNAFSNHIKDSKTNEMKVFSSHNILLTPALNLILGTLLAAFLIALINTIFSQGYQNFTGNLNKNREF